MAIDPKILEQFRAPTGGKFRLDDYDPAWLPPQAKGMDKGEIKEFARGLLAENVTDVGALQDRLYAADSHSLLLVFQALVTGKILQTTRLPFHWMMWRTKLQVMWRLLTRIILQTNCLSCGYN